MRHFVALIFIALLAPLALASIAGTVFSNSGDPLAGARVTARRALAPIERRARILSGESSAPLASAATNDEGAFTLNLKVDGVVTVEIERDGFAPATQLALADDQNVTVELPAAARRTGRVTANGEPVAGAHVVATSDEVIAWMTRTDESGTYAIPAPDKWCQSVAIVHPDFAPLTIDLSVPSRSLDATLVKGSTIAGKVVDAAGRPAASVRVVAGPWSMTTSSEDGTFTLLNVSAAVKKVEALGPASYGLANRTPEALTIRLESRQTIGGTIRNANKRPLAGVPVAAFGREWHEMNSVVSDESGHYRIEHCETGVHTVVAYGAGDLEFERANIAAGKRGADLIAKKSELLIGIVVDERKKPIAGATVVYTVPQTPLLYGFSARSQTISGRSGSDGRFRLKALPDLTSYAGLRLSALRRGYALGLSEPLDLERRAGITITLPTGLELQGVVVDAAGEPIAGAGVIAVQDPFGGVALPFDSALAGGMLAPFVETDEAGRFTLRLNEAPHDLGAWKSGYAGTRTSDVVVQQGLDPLKIVLDRGASLQGRVVSKDAPIAEGGMLMVQGESSSFAMTVVGADGTFTLQSLRPGTYELQYRGEDGRTAKARATAPAADVVLELAATGTIHGRVVDAVTHEALTSYSVSAPDGMSEEIDGEQFFTLSVTPGSPEVTVQATGYVPVKQIVNVVAGKTTEITLSVTRGRRASGRVIGGDGRPVANATVTNMDLHVMENTTEDGDFAIEEALPRELVALEVSATGYVERTVEIPAGESDARVDVVLSLGRRASGRVISSDGAPVDGAEVMAYGDSRQESKTGADGTFTLTGLGEGTYSFRATRDELESEPATNVDPAAGPIVLRMKPSAGAGAVHGSVKGLTEGGWTFGYVMASRGMRPAMIGRDGKFRIEKLPAGEVELRANIHADHGQSSSAAVKVTIVANEDVETELVFRNDIVVRGTVYEGGTPVPGRTVIFSAQSGSWSATSNETGAYEVRGLEPGAMYDVGVQGGPHDYTTQYQVAGSSTFDIRIDWLQVEGRVVDLEGASLGGVEIEMAAAGARQKTVDAKSDAAGAFVITVPRAAALVGTFTKEGFATVTQRFDAVASPLLVKMLRTDGVRVRLVDARTGKNLDGYAAAVDEDGQQLARAQKQPDGTLRVPLSAGTYRIAVSAEGYASLSARTAVPRTDELRIALTPGGTLVVASDRPSADLIRLVLPNGEEYVRCQCNGIAEIRLSGATTTINHVAPGTYAMQVLDGRGFMKTSYAVTIVEGQTTTAEIHLPE